MIVLLTHEYRRIPVKTPKTIPKKTAITAEAKTNSRVAGSFSNIN